MQDKTRWKAFVYSWFWSWILRRDLLKKEVSIASFPRGETKSSSFEIFYEETTAQTQVSLHAKSTKQTTQSLSYIHVPLPLPRSFFANFMPILPNKFRFDFAPFNGVLSSIDDDENVGETVSNPLYESLNAPKLSDLLDESTDIRHCSLKLDENVPSSTPA